jgi:hypothetical protein
MKILGPIPNHILEKMDPKDRPKGVPGMTSAEIRSAAVDKAEKELQKEVATYLRGCRGVEFINPPMHKRSSLPLGWPDFTFAYKPPGSDIGIPITWECKRVTGSLDPDQITMRDRLIANGWQWRLIRHLGEAQAHLRDLERGDG